MPIQQMFLGLGGVSDVEYAASDNQTNIVLSTVFGSDWASNKPKIYTVASGVDVGGTSTHAIHADSGMGGTLSIVVAGTVTGFGGTGGARGAGGYGRSGLSGSYAGSAGGNGNPGGTAIRIDSSNVTVTNTGTISGGGGGGGGGGGAGGYQYFIFGKYGGSGGYGGNGAGWNQSQSNGPNGYSGGNSPTSSSGGSYPGAKGGNGGTLGNDGQQGNVGNNYSGGWSSSRSPGGYRGLHGAAGAAIAGSSYTLSNSGTINGAS